MTEEQWERKLNIQTRAKSYEKKDDHHSPYEPTAYAVLERLAASGLIVDDNVLVDYGCGKGRVGIYLNYVLGCRTIGVEYNRELYEQACQNALQSQSRNKADDSVSFVCCNAEVYTPDDSDSFYFFNPFSVRILHSVLERIFESYYSNPRAMRLYFYYALDEYLSLLMTDVRLEFECEIDCRDLFHNDDPRERILVYRIG